MTEVVGPMVVGVAVDVGNGSEVRGAAGGAATPTADAWAMVVVCTSLWMIEAESGMECEECDDCEGGNEANDGVEGGDGASYEVSDGDGSPVVLYCGGGSYDGWDDGDGGTGGVYACTCEGDGLVGTESDACRC